CTRGQDAASISAAAINTGRCAQFANQETSMRELILATLLFGQLIIGCSQTKENKENKFTADFFHGAWGDSLKDKNGGQGIILGTKNDFYFIWDGNISGGDNFDKNLKLTYNLILDKKPFEVEIISKYID